MSRERIQHLLKNELWPKPLKFQKVQELTDGQKKWNWIEPRSYFACTEVASYRTWFSLMRSHPKLSSLWTTKWSGLLGKEVSWIFTPAIGHQNSSAADGIGVSHRNARWPLPARIYRSWGQNKCRILSGKYLKGSIEALDISAADHGHSNRTQHRHTQHVSTKNHLIRRSLTSFLLHNGYQNLLISIRWNFTPKAFLRVRFSLKNTKMMIISRRRFAKNGPKFGSATFVQPVMPLSSIWRP